MERNGTEAKEDSRFIYWGLNLSPRVLLVPLLLSSEHLLVLVKPLHVETQGGSGNEPQSQELLDRNSLTCFMRSGVTPMLRRVSDRFFSSRASSAAVFYVRHTDHQRQLSNGVTATCRLVNSAPLASQRISPESFPVAGALHQDQSVIQLTPTPPGKAEEDGYSAITGCQPCCIVVDVRWVAARVAGALVLAAAHRSLVDCSGSTRAKKAKRLFEIAS